MRRLVSFILLMLWGAVAYADGGMWLPILAEQRISDMQKKGLKLTPEDIYSVNKACMKDAVMIFGGGCTAELVSNQGLILTNHHCGRSYIQGHSTLDNDILTNGFWAKDKNGEIICNGLKINILSYMEDVTPRFKNNADYDSVANLILAEAKAKNGIHYNCEIEKFYAGNQYYLFVYQTFKDVRLVGCPPSAVGDFGGDTDNWMWPRHSGDFSMFRIYADKDNNPAEISSSNVPYKPKKYFKISLKGVNEGDFTMVFGFPGSTEEYKSAAGVEFSTNTLLPARIMIRAQKMEIMQEAINRSRAVRLMYTSRLASVENAKKKWEGEILGIKQCGVIQMKKDFEQKFIKKASSNATYAKLPQQFNNLYQRVGKNLRADSYFTEAIYTLPFFDLARTMAKLESDCKADNPQEIINNVNATRTKLLSALASRDSTLERNLFCRMIKIYADSCPDYTPFWFKELYFDQFGGNAERFTEYFYNNSIITDTTKLKTVINKYIAAAKTGKRAEKTFVELNNQLISDPAAKFVDTFINMYFSKISGDVNYFDFTSDNLNKLYQKALLETMPESIPYPDANFTLRFTYGKNERMTPRDGIEYKPFTTLDGVIAKDNPDIYDYHVPEKLKQLHAQKDYGQYADKDGTLHVCFIASNHTTGGNSGSPVINADGNLIGINFDRNWEGTMSDIHYSRDLCRNISVDIRYVLFLIDKVGGAKHIINELDIVK